MSGYFRLGLFEQDIEYFAVYFKALILETVHIPKKLITKDQIRKNLKRLNLPNYDSQNNDRVSHTLNITDIRS